MDSNRFFERKIKSIDYDPEYKTLLIEFKSGASKKYFEIPNKMYNELSKATDQTMYYKEHIDGHFKVE